MKRPQRTALFSLLGAFYLGAHITLTSVAAPNATTPTVDCLALRQTLADTWDTYKAVYIQADGRVRDPNAENISTSESQAYGLLRAVWMNDDATFNRVWTWSHNNLRLSAKKAENSRLFAWKWGQKPDGTWGVLEQDSASDADEDIALALLLASERWPASAATYRAEAKALLGDIWAKEVIDVRKFGPTLLPGDWPHNPAYWLLNPSYFGPLSYRLFAQADSTHPWEKLIGSSYAIVEAALPTTRTGLPPNWLKINRGKDKGAGVGVFLDPDDHRSDYGYDAIRLYWRFGMDYLLTGDTRARDVLRHSNFLERYWFVRHKLPSPLTIDGIERNLDEILTPSNAIYGATLIHLTTAYPEIGHTIVKNHILAPLNHGLWQPEKDYYAQNWLWLGLWAYTGQHCGGPTIKGSLPYRLLHWADNPATLR